jgi:hypothetical protein
MTGPDAPITQRDLAAAVQAATLSSQVAELSKDVAELKANVDHRLNDHEHQHDKEAAARVVSRRWLIGTAIAFLVAIEGPISYIVVHLK